MKLQVVATIQLQNDTLRVIKVDTGAQCNMVPIYLYKKTTKDYKLTHVSSGAPSGRQGADQGALQVS